MEQNQEKVTVVKEPVAPDWYEKGLKLLVGGRTYYLDQDLGLYRMVQNELGRVIAPADRNKIKEEAKEAGIPEGSAVCLLVPTQEKKGLDARVLGYIGRRLLKFQGEACTGYGVTPLGRVVAVVPEQQVSGGSVDCKWEKAIETIFRLGAERGGTIHTHPGGMAQPSGEGGDIGDWKKFPGIHYIIARTGKVGAYFSLGGAVWTLPWIYPDVELGEEKPRRRGRTRVAPDVLMVGEDGQEDFDHLVREKKIIVPTWQVTDWGWRDWFGRDTETSGEVDWEKYKENRGGTVRAMRPDSLEQEWLLVAARVWGREGNRPPEVRQVRMWPSEEEATKPLAVTTPARMVRSTVGGVDHHAQMPVGGGTMVETEIWWDPAEREGMLVDRQGEMGVGDLASLLWEISETAETSGLALRMRELTDQMEKAALEMVTKLTGYLVLTDGYGQEQAPGELRRRLKAMMPEGNGVRGENDRDHHFRIVVAQLATALMEGWFSNSSWKPVPEDEPEMGSDMMDEPQMDGEEGVAWYE